VEVTASEAGGGVRHLRDLGSGTYFGEIGLTRGLPRTATVTTTASTTLWRIDATDFFAALQITGLSSTAMARSARWLTFSHPHLSTAGIDDSATRPAGAADG
jgi:CRP-like cAMP-binding protein